MGKVFYVENLHEYILNIDRDNENLPVPLGENLIEINSEEQHITFIEAIKKTDYVEDSELKKFLQDTFPEFLKYTKKTPVNIKEFKKDIDEIFFEIPDYLYEEDNTFNALKHILNYIIKKNEIAFLVPNILNGKLQYYDQKYRYKNPYQFYFRMMKLNYDIPEYFSYVLNSQRLMERIFLKDLVFSDRKNIGKKDLEWMRYLHNLVGKNLVDFRTFLMDLLSKIVKEERYVKRTRIPLPPDYWEQKEMLVENIEDTLQKTEKEIQDIMFRKEEIVRFIQEKKGLINKENFKILLDVLGISDWFF